MVVMELLVTGGAGGGIPPHNVLNWLVIQTRLQPASPGHRTEITFLTPFSSDQGQVAPLALEHHIYPDFFLP